METSKFSQKLKTFWDKIKPLDYKVNPIGSFKVELYMWLALLSILGYMSGTSYVFNLVYGFNYVPFFVIIIISLIAWARLATLVSRYLIDKNKDNC